MQRFSEALYFLGITLWVGGLWAIGYVAAPVLFAQLPDRQLAGMLAGKMFWLVGLVGIGTAVYATGFLIARWRVQVARRTVFWLVLVMAALSIVQLFGVQPLMDQLKQQALPRQVMESVLRDRFAMWHGISSILYLLQSLLGLWLVAWSGRGLR